MGGINSRPSYFLGGLESNIVLRFPLNKKVLLITTAGSILCEIVRATDDFIFCKNAEYQDQKLGKLYVDRSSIIAFKDFSQDKNELKEKIKQARIIDFNDYFLKNEGV